MQTKVKIAVSIENKDTPCWPCINYDFDKELSRIVKTIVAVNPFIDFTVVQYTEREQAEADYEKDLQIYDGVLVLLMTCWKDIDLFYARKAKQGGLPVIIADVPYCGSGSILARTSGAIRNEKLPTPLLSTLDYVDIAKNVKLFHVIRKMRDTKILVIANDVLTAHQQAATDVWGCSFINRTAKDLHAYYEKVSAQEIQNVVQMWTQEAADVLEPSGADLEQSAQLYLALQRMKDDVGADAITVDCLTLSYGDGYGNNAHMYPTHVPVPVAL